VSESQLSKLLKLAREKKGLSQQQVAEQLNISQRSYAFYEEGRRVPKWARLKKIGHILGIESEVLLEFYGVSSEQKATNSDQNSPDIDTGEPTSKQILMVLAEAFRSQTGIIKSMESKMALETSLQEVLAGVETIVDRQGPAIQKILGDLDELKRRKNGP
jgi:transcriptional regulator with XRE-family HTH domain